MEDNNQLLIAFCILYVLFSGNKLRNQFLIDVSGSYFLILTCHTLLSKGQTFLVFNHPFKQCS